MINLWHDMLNLPKYDKAWHQQDIADELLELEQAAGFFDTWSEISDVAYTYSRALWSGHQIDLPLSRAQYIAGMIYTVPKISLRWLFFRRAGQKLHSKQPVREIRNPKKSAKLISIADRYGLDHDEFQKTCESQLRYWPLLK